MSVTAPVEKQDEDVGCSEDQGLPSLARVCDVSYPDKERQLVSAVL